MLLTAEITEIGFKTHNKYSNYCVLNLDNCILSLVITVQQLLEIPEFLISPVSNMRCFTEMRNMSSLNCPAHVKDTSPLNPGSQYLAGLTTQLKKRLYECNLKNISNF